VVLGRNGPAARFFDLPARLCYFWPGMKKQAFLIGPALAAFLLVPLIRAQDAGAPPARTEPPPNTFGPLEKSLLIPGWGQFSEHRYLEGVIFLGSELVCLIQALRNNALGNEAYDRYKAAAGRDEAVLHRRSTETFDTRRNRYLLAGAAVWALNLLDMVLIVKNSGRPKSAWTFRIQRDENQAIVFMAGRRF